MSNVLPTELRSRLLIQNIREQLAKHIDDECVVADLAVDMFNCVVENCYEVARGTDKLQTQGNRQLYWKGRCDAATDVRALKQK